MLLKKVEAFCKTTAEYFPVADTIPVMERLAPSCDIPTAWVHGDFWHGNLIIDSRRKLWVTDFAFSAPDEPPIDILDLISDYEPWIFLSPERLKKYILPYIPKEINPLFLVLYMLNRKMALKVREKVRALR